ncbi:MAG TPA: hypothetical protein VF765_14640 [Polyangiaceae bacterium]
MGVVNAIWFSSLTNGDVSIGPDSNARIAAGSVEHMSGPLQADTVAVNGLHTAAGGGNDVFTALWPTAAGLAAISLNGPPKRLDFIVSADQGHTFTRSRFYGSLAQQGWNFGPPLALSRGNDGTWRELDALGGTWTSPMAPSPSSRWTSTWHWAAA